MKCPLICKAAAASRLPASQVVDDCVKADCAWWDENGDRCSILELSRLFNAIGNTLGSLVKELTLLRPPGGH